MCRLYSIPEVHCDCTYQIEQNTFLVSCFSISKYKKKNKSSCNTKSEFNSAKKRDILRIDKDSLYNTTNYWCNRKSPILFSPSTEFTNLQKNNFPEMLKCCHPVNPPVSIAENEQRQNSKDIDKTLDVERKEYEATIRLLLLGAGESGKSTFAKQMQIINLNGFNKEERQLWIPDIYSNVRESISTILNAMKTLGISFVSDTKNSCSERVLEKCSEVPFTPSQVFFKDCQLLWKDADVLNCYNRSNEYHLIDSAKYFLDKLNELSDDEYLPSDQDILRCRLITNHIKQIKFVQRDVKFHLFDVGGQRSQRRKWIQCFNDVTAIVFITASSGYNLVLREDESKNRLNESIELFQEVWTNRFLQRVSVILFLNKQDQLRAKILDGRFKLEEHFPSFKHYSSPTLNKNERRLSDVATMTKKELEFNRAKCFIRDEFLKICNKSSNGMHMCYPHFTTAIDTENIKKVFMDCRNIIRKIHLDRFGILPADRD